MSKRFLSGINVTGTATLNTVANAGLDTDKFLVLDAAGNVDFRTGAEIRLDIGADVVSRVQHEVKLGESMTIGTPVYVPLSQDSGTNMTVLKASNASEGTSSKTMGLIASSGITNDLVQVITEGLLAGLNTGSATKGDPVWLGVNGALIFGLTNKPVAPAHLVFIGIVTRAQTNNGEIFVKVQNGFEMNELHNYAEGSVQNNEVIVYESATSLYKPKTIPTILGYTPVPDSRTITINGTTYDLSANRAWTITTDASARSILRYVATANQTTFTISGGYTPGLTDVYRNGVKLDNSTDFTATNGTTIVLTNGASVNDVIEVYRYQTAFLANNALRVITEFIATAGQTTFNVTYNSGLVDVFYNGSKLLSTEYTAGNGTSIVLNFPCNVNDTLEVHAYSYQVGAFTGQAQLNGTGFVKVSGTTVTYDNSTYLTTASASSTYLPLSGGTLTGNLTLSSASTPLLQIVDTTNSKSLLFGADDNNTFIRSSSSTPILFQVNGGDTALTLASNQAAAFSSSVLISRSTAFNAGTYTSQKLQVTGGIGINSDAADGVSRLTLLGNSSTGDGTIDWGGNGNFNLVFSNNGNERLKINSSGSTAFVFRNVSGEVMDLLVSTESANPSKSKLSLMWYGNETASIKFKRGGDATGGSLEFWTQAETQSIAQRMTILSNGKIGINTTEPNNLLHIVGTTPQIRVSYSSASDNRYAELSWYGVLGYAQSSNNDFNLGIIGGNSGYGNLIFNTGATQTERMRITSGGNVGIGVNPQARFEVLGYNGNLRMYGQGGITENQISSNVYYNGSSWVRDNASYGAAAIALESSNGQILFYTTGATSGFPTERMRILSGGEVVFQNSIQLRNGQINSLSSGGGGQSMYLNFQGNGAIYAGSSYAVLYAGSDRRIKTDIVDAESTLNKILSLTPRTFRYKERPEFTNYGFIAQEVEEVMPEIVKTSEGVTMCNGEEIENQKSIESYGLAWASILVKAIQEQQAQIEELKALIAAK